MSTSFILTFDADTGGKRPHTFFIGRWHPGYKLMPMLNKAGLIEGTKDADGKLAGEIVEVIEKGLHDILAHPDEYRDLEASTTGGWAVYGEAVGVISEMLQACKDHPKATINITP